MGSDSPSSKRMKAVRLGRYEVVKHIAKGGMGAVYLARDPERDRDVAIKVLPPDTKDKAGALARFKREFQAAARLHHANIVTLHDFGEHQGVHFLVMEYVEGTDEGRDLQEYIDRKGRLDAKEACFITHLAAKALHHAHKRGVVHRDIKPSNFLLSRKDGPLGVKLTDFGLAVRVDENEFRVTRDGSTVGTVDYMSPEQARDSRAADVRSDIYSLGCTLYHMLAGSPPFPDGGLTERLLKHKDEPPADVRDFNARVPDWLAKVVARMLAKDPADRYQSAKELLKALVTGKDPEESRQDILRSLAEMEMAATGKGKRASSGRVPAQPAGPRPPSGPIIRRIAPSRADPPDEEDESDAPTIPASKYLLLAAAVIAGVALLLAAVALVREL